jgi:sec-independent protein translocase protein TatA
MLRLGGWEWIIILVIVVLLFGPGRIGKISGELGRSIKAFREGLSSDNNDDNSTDSDGNIEQK